VLQKSTLKVFCTSCIVAIISALKYIEPAMHGMKIFEIYLPPFENLRVNSFENLRVGSFRKHKG
jgi:hypothetical protein